MREKSSQMVISACLVMTTNKAFRLLFLETAVFSTLKLARKRAPGKDNTQEACRLLSDKIIFRSIF